MSIFANAGQEYFFQVGSYNNNSAGCELCLGVTVTIEDACANENTPPVTALTSPLTFGECACNPVTITGSAYEPDGGDCDAGCFADFSGNGIVGPEDLSQLLGNWGPCPP